MCTVIMKLTNMKYLFFVSLHFFIFILFQKEKLILFLFFGSVFKTQKYILKLWKYQVRFTFHYNI